MQASFDDGKLFYKLYSLLLSFANETFGIVPHSFASIEQYTSLPVETRLKVRDGLFAKRELIDRFVQENPAELPADELAIVAGWKHALVGQFYIFRYLANYAVFLSSDKPVKAYGVLALADPLEAVVGPYLPRLYHVVLLPLKGKIIYDGLLSGYNLTFGGGIKRMLNEEYRRAKDAFGVIASLPESGLAAKKPTTRPKKAKRPVAARREEAKDIRDAVIGMTDAFCKDYLNEEYAEVCRKLAGVLAHKRPPPLLRGKLEGWASGIVRVIGRVNFLDDPSQTPHLKLVEIDKAFGVGESTGYAKSQAIRKMLNMHQFDPEWTLPSRLEENPLVWLLKVNGLLMDIRDAPREAQVVAYEQGLIPYIPADRADSPQE
jgi:hypothetical protein